MKKLYALFMKLQKNVGYNNGNTMDLETARKKYKNSEITFNELDKIFFLEATKKELNQFLKTPVYDRANYIIGKSLGQINKEWQNLLSEK